MVKPIRRKVKHLSKERRKDRELVQHDESIDRFTDAMEATLSNRLALVVRLQALVNDPKVTDHSPRTEVGHLHRFFFRRVVNSLYAICTLVTHGAVHDAKVLLRTMFEFAVSAAYLKACPTSIELFKRFEAIEKYKWVNDLVEANFLDKTKLDRWAELKAAELQWRVEGLSQSYWTGKKFIKTVGACGSSDLREFYKWYYPEASKYVHPSPTGLQWQIDSESNDLELYPLKADPLILGLAIGFCADVFGIYSEHEGLGVQNELDAIIAEERKITLSEKQGRAAIPDET